MILTYMSIIMVSVGAIILIFSFFSAIKIGEKTNDHIRNKWVIIISLIGIFILGYILFNIILMLEYQFPTEPVTGFIFLSGAVFVFIIISVSKNTIYTLQNAEKELIERARHAELRAAISAAFVQHEDLKSQLQLCAESIVKNLDVAFVRIWVISKEDESLLELYASAGMYTHLDGNHSAVKIGEHCIGIIIQKKDPYLANKVNGDLTIADQEWAIREGLIGFAAYPFILAGRVLGGLAVFSRKPIKNSTLRILASVSDEVALGIERKISEDKIHTLAFYDSLTALPNRYLFKELLKRYIENAKRYRLSFALVLIDIDDFSRINDTLGHDIGDDLLKAVSSRLLKIIRSSDYVARIYDKDESIARIGGDEFIVLIQELDGIINANEIAKRLLKESSKAFKFGDREIFMTVSIGIVVYPPDGSDIESLIKNAGTALYHAKKRGKNNFQFFSKSMNENSLELLNLESELHRAIERKEFELYYQPKVDIITKKIVGMEALIRWKKPDGSLISPAKFIPLAEKNGLIIPIGKIVLYEACRQNKMWQETFHDKVSVAVNISGIQFGQKYFFNDVLAAIESANLDPKYLELEITETTIMIDPERAVHNLNELKNLGITISLDDFGTGYSSLSYLQRLPINSIKIDLSFIKNVVTNTNDASIVKAIIAMAKNLNLQTIAEGVEDEYQLEFLKEHECDIIQGYFFSPPVPAEEFYNLLLQYNE